MQLESLSREDWVKYSKRQALLLQKAKGRCEGEVIICGQAMCCNG